MHRSLRFLLPSPLGRPGRGGILALATVSLLAVACGEEEAPPPEPQVLNVKMVEIGSAETGETREYPGRIQAWQHSEMGFEVPGKIIELNFVEGQPVEKGFVLARLDLRDFEADVKKAQANRARAFADYKRYEKLLKEGVSSKAEFEAREQHFKVREAELRQANKALEDAALTAPFAGVVARKLVDDFENVRAKQPVLILQDLSKLKTRVTVPESDMGGERKSETNEEITAKLRPQVVVSSLPDRKFDAKVWEISQVADPVTRTFEATFYFPYPTGLNVLPGMTAKLIAQLSGSAGSHWVPGIAVTADDEEQPMVWRVDPEEMVVRPARVSVGGLKGDLIEITSGLEVGDLVATSGIQNLRDGARVRRYGRK
ncbi:MAG: efflux RND transporter periplasmic adaptor subunit [Deltaproteobacteria bacterium]|nr:efflux RND transporter periplasmic adaptor subunit [Deltaproteobacteria bacterium]MBW2418732.1 efflux RND transporter periplasmic adaptor subunit [Deltaproteobacteria bacterium]